MQTLHIQVDLIFGLRVTGGTHRPRSNGIFGQHPASSIECPATPTGVTAEVQAVTHETKVSPNH